MVRARPASHRPGEGRGARARSAADSHRPALPRARGRPRRPHDQGRPIPLVATRRAAARDHEGARRAPGRSAARAVRRDPTPRRGRAGPSARARVRVVRPDTAGRGIPRSSAPRPALADRRRRHGARRGRRQGAATGHRDDRRRRPGGAAPRRRMAQPREVRLEPRGPPLARRGVRGHEPPGDRLPAGSGATPSGSPRASPATRGSPHPKSSGSARRAAC